MLSSWATAEGKTKNTVKKSLKNLNTSLENNSLNAEESKSNKGTKDMRQKMKNEKAVILPAISIMILIWID